MREQSLPLRQALPDPGVPERVPLPEPVLVTSFDTQRANRTGIVVTVLLHALVVLIALLQPDKEAARPAKRSSDDITYIVPRQRQADVPVPAPVKPAVKPQQKAPPRVKPPPRQERVEMARLPDTITTPPEPKQETRPPEPPRPAEIPKVDPAQDMSDMIAARRRARQRESGVEEQETEAQRGERRARENIASANRQGQSDDKGKNESMFSHNINSPFTASLKFRGFNTNFKRMWLREVEVELGSEPDIETAIIKKMVEMIRKETKGQNFTWDSRRLGRDVIMSPRVEDNEALEAFLFKETFPQHRRSR